MERIPCSEQVCASPTEDVHHLWYPRSEYKTPTERQFRNLGCNLVRICRCQHNDIHATNEYPTKPPRSFMLSEIERMK